MNKQIISIIIGLVVIIGGIYGISTNYLPNTSDEEPELASIGGSLCDRQGQTIITTGPGGTDPNHAFNSYRDCP